ncbi:MAG: hypothetical protein CO135_02810 [Candidatus Levybacteria bacterium CG_4_9_14_3_um_filter_35_16]|nr:MAG: hypothetical protein COW87_02205 [Candidatus Levybacteria bacterium CG22_combo_CG10-13_8_21_14_all_35_11]PJA91128.1 MAG: hypothetical protein CO135_02810 [Candidatus Levybacteria bacterium CG_4_9_14_3_um_filter_35_16]PJC54360.1 MAG: hypothetical protein CO028_02825 [Candidatus Levybacteria bacterium CG_4_9_14_0_2_um_filter_35_21]
MDFEFLQNPITKKWMVSAPRRAKRPDQASGTVPFCPFCVENDKKEELFRVKSESPKQAKRDFGVEADWNLRILENKFPFAPIHEVIIHSPDHNNNFERLPIKQAELILKTYKERYKLHQGKGQVYIFHNRGKKAGESIPHPHTQLVVIPYSVHLEIPRLDPESYVGIAPHPLEISKLSDKTNSLSRRLTEKEEMVDNEYFYIFCPHTSEWPDEVWVAPKRRGKLFGEITDVEVQDLAHVLIRLIQIFTLRHGNEFSFNFYIYPDSDWYLRLIPRIKTLGGFELGTDVFVNTQDPKETLAFLKEHFNNPDEEKILKENQATYRRGV